MPGPSKKEIAKSYRGIERVEIINGKERVKLVGHTRREVRVEGEFGDPRFGASVSSDKKTLYLVGYRGTLHLPPQIDIRIKQGVDDLRRELFETYAPLVSFTELESGEEELAQMAEHRKVAAQRVIDCLAKIYGATGLPLFAPLSELNNPVTLDGITHDIATERFDREHRFDSRLDERLAGDKAEPLVALSATAGRDLDSQVAAMVYAVARKTHMPSGPTQEIRKGALDIARQRDYTLIRSLRNAMLVAGRFEEMRVEAGRGAMEKGWEDIAAAVETMDRQGAGFGPGLVQEAEPLPRPLGGDLLADRLVNVSLAARRQPSAKSTDIFKGAATVGVTVGSARNVEDWGNTRRAAKVGSYVAYAAGQLGLDHSFPDRPDRPPTADEVRRAIQLADAGRQAAALEFEERRAAARKHVDELAIELAQAPPQKVRQRTKDKMNAAAGAAGVEKMIKEREELRKKINDTVQTGASVEVIVMLTVVIVIGAVMVALDSPSPHK